MVSQIVKSLEKELDIISVVINISQQMIRYQNKLISESDIDKDCFQKYLSENNLYLEDFDCEDIYEIYTDNKNNVIIQCKNMVWDYCGGDCSEKRWAIIIPDSLIEAYERLYSLDYDDADYENKYKKLYDAYHDFVKDYISNLMNGYLIQYKDVIEQRKKEKALKKQKSMEDKEKAEREMLALLSEKYKS